MDSLNETLVRECGEENLDAVTCALHDGADINYQDAQGRTALLISVQKNNLKMAELLMEKGADQSIRDNTMLTPFLCAGANGFHEILELLIKKGADVKSTNRFGGTALLPSSEKGFLRTVELCIDNGVDVNHVNALGWSALLEAVILGNGGLLYSDIIKTLVDAGADCALKDNSGVSAFEYAEKFNQRAVLKILNNDVSQMQGEALKPIKLSARAGDYKQAFNQLQNERAKLSHELYLFYRGYLLTLLKSYEEAVNTFNLCKDNNPEFYFYTANTYRLMGQTDLALAEFDLGLEKSETPDFFRYHKSNYLRELGLHEEAVKTMGLLLETDKDRYDYSFHLSNSLRSLGRHSEAAEAIENAIKNDPCNPLYHFHKAKSYELLGDTKKAAAICEKLLLTDPHHRDALAMLEKCR